MIVVAWRGKNPFMEALADAIGASTQVIRVNPAEVPNETGWLTPYITSDCISVVTDNSLAKSAEAEFASAGMQIKHIFAYGEISRSMKTLDGMCTILSDLAAKIRDAGFSPVLIESNMEDHIWGKQWYGPQIQEKNILDVIRTFDFNNKRGGASFDLRTLLDMKFDKESVVLMMDHHLYRECASYLSGYRCMLICPCCIDGQAHPNNFVPIEGTELIPANYRGEHTVNQIAAKILE